MQFKRRVLLVLISAALAAAGAVTAFRPAADPVRRAVRNAMGRVRSGDIDGAVRAADLAFHVSGGANGTAGLSALMRTMAGDLPTAFARMEVAARRDPHDAESALAAGLLARCIGRTARNGPELRRRAGEWFDEAARRADAASSAGTTPGAFGPATVAVAARLAAGNVDDAKRRLVALRPETLPQHEQAALLGAAVSVASRDFDGATATLRAAAAKWPSERLAAAIGRIQTWRTASGEPELITGLRAWSEGDVEATETALARWIERHPADPVALCVLATALARSGNGPTMVRCTDLLHATVPDGPAEPYFLGCHLLARGRPEDAVWMLTLAAQRAPDDEHVFRAVAEAHLARDQPEQAAEVCRAWIARRGPDASSPVASYFLGIALETTGDLVGAESAYRTVFLNAPPGVPADAPAVDRLSDLLVRTGRADEAATLVQAAVDAAPDSTPLRVRLAVTLLATDRRDDAERLLRDVARDAPSCAAAHVQLGRVLAARCGVGESTAAAHEATAAFETALRLDPEAIDARLGLIGLARSAAVRGDSRGARSLDAHRAALRDEAARSPSAARSFALGAAAEIAGDIDEAETRYRDALRREPRLGVAANNLAWLLAVRRRNPVEARTFADDAVRCLPRSPQALDTRGWVRYLTREFGGAEADIARARAALPRDADIAVRHARVLLALGRPEPARAALRAAFTVAPRLRRDPLVRSVARSAELEMDR